MHRLALVWFKRDLRMAAHAPLHTAAQYLAADALYVVEPQWVHSPKCNAQHRAFAVERVEVRNVERLYEGWWEAHLEPRYLEARRSGLPDTQRRHKPAMRARTSPRQATLFTEEETP